MIFFTNKKGNHTHMKMKTWIGIAAGIIFSTGVVAEDYSTYSNEELRQKRSEVRNMSEAERAAYRNEMQKRMNSMSDAEREQMRQGGNGGGQGQEGGRRRMNQ